MAVFRFTPGLDPAAALLTLQRELRRTEERPYGIDLGPSGRGVYPPLNVFTNREGYVLRLEVPGVTPESVTLETQGRTLAITGKREVQPPAGGSFHRRERGAGEFSRSLQLPADLDLSKADASLKNGMLSIFIPKKEEAKPRQISVKAA